MIHVGFRFRWLVAGLLGFSLLACLPAPTVPVTPANAAQVASCQGIAGLHNDLVIGDMAFGLGGTTVGTIAAIDTNPNDRTALAITTAALAGLAGIGGAIVAYASQEYAVGNCSEVVPIPSGGEHH
jgi:hypothetical protein